MTSKLFVLALIGLMACATDVSEFSQGGAAGGGSVVGTSEALIVGTYTFKNSNNGANMQSTTEVNALRGIIMGQDPRSSANSWACQVQAGGIVSQCTSTWAGQAQKMTLSSADCVLQPPQTGYTWIKKCPFKFGVGTATPTLMGTITWYAPTGRFWSIQGEVTNFVPGQTFQVFSTTGTEAGWNERVQSK